jgi:hypothetical protein
VIKLELPLVIHADYGGFSLTNAIVEKLRERNWAHMNSIERTSSDSWYVMHEREGELRRDPELIDVVRKFETELKELQTARVGWREFKEAEMTLLHGLKVVNVTIEVDVEDCDGKETVHVCGGVW